MHLSELSELLANPIGVPNLEPTPCPVDHAFRANVMSAFNLVISDMSGEDPGFLVSDAVRDVVMKSIVDLANAGQMDADQLRRFGLSQGKNFRRNHENGRPVRPKPEDCRTR